MGKGHWQRSHRADYAIRDLASDFIRYYHIINNLRLRIWRFSIVLTLCLVLPSDLNLFSQVLIISISIVSMGGVFQNSLKFSLLVKIDMEANVMKIFVFFHA